MCAVDVLLQGATSLHHAALDNNVKIAKALLCHGANIDSQDAQVSVGAATYLHNLLQTF